jgi:hypothetical protein
MVFRSIAKKGTEKVTKELAKKGIGTQQAIASSSKNLVKGGKFTPAARAAATKKGKLSKSEKTVLTRLANRMDTDIAGVKKVIKKQIADEAKPKPKPKTAKPKTSEPKRTPAENKELRRLIKQQEDDAKGIIRTKRERELMPIEAYKESNPLEKKAGAGSGPLVSGDIMRGKAVTREQMKELEDMDKAGAIGFQITGKRAGGKVRGTGAATRGFGKAGYSYKNM